MYRHMFRMLFRTSITKNAVTRSSIFMGVSRTACAKSLAQRHFCLTASAAGQISTVLHTSERVKVPITTRSFHTSQSCQAIPPVLWLFVKPVAKLTSMITARYYRRKLISQNISWQERFYRTRYYFAAGLGLLFTAVTIDYYTHIEEAPITKRKRYLAFTKKQFNTIQNIELELLQTEIKGKLLPSSDPRYDLIIDVVSRIIRANQNIPFFAEQNWKIHIIQDPAFNAFVLPAGHIFINTGVLRTVRNIDQLAVVMGHEMAHALLSHAIEKVGYAQLIDYLVIAVMAILWFFMPSDGVALVTQWFSSRVIQLLLDLPYSRKLETEADEVGLLLTAKACYDIREGPNLWNLLWILTRTETDEDNNLKGEMPEFLSTHPATETRAEFLDSLVPKVLETRKACLCPPLPKRDPRVDMAYLKSLVERDLAEVTVRPA